jgi:hypothetical protein
MFEKVLLKISWLFGGLLLVADFNVGEVILVSSLKALDCPLELFLSDLPVYVVV